MASTPIFPATPKVSWGKLIDDNTNYDGTGDVVELFVAGENGSRIDMIKIKPLGTNVATVMRLFLNNGSSPTTPANNSLIFELTLPETTASQIASLAEYQEVLDIAIPTGYKLYGSLGTEVASGYQVTVFGGDY
jgi:hypothetical protein